MGPAALLRSIVYRFRPGAPIHPTVFCMTDGQTKPAVSYKRIILSAVAGLIAAVATVHYMPKPLPEFTRQELMDEVKAGNVPTVTIIDGEVLTSESTQKGPFRVPLRRGDDELARQLAGMGVEVRYEKDTGLIP